MIMTLLMLLAILAVAIGVGVARDNNASDENLTWAGFSRTQVKKTLRRMGSKAPCGASLAALMGDEAWLAVHPAGAKATRGESRWIAVPREGRATKGVGGERPVVGGAAKKARRTVTTTRAAVAAKRVRDRAATAARQAVKATRSSNRAHAKGVWTARLRQELADRRAAAARLPWGGSKISPGVAGEWALTIRRARCANDLLAVARETSVSRIHAVADGLEAALREQAAATTDFAKARARASVSWAAADLRQELLAA